MYVLTYWVHLLHFYPDYEVPDDPTSQSTKSICEEILCLCDYSPPPLVSTLMTYRAPLAGLLAAAAVTYV